MWSEMAYFLLDFFFFFFAGLRLCLTFLLCDTVDESLSLIETFFFLAEGTVCSCFSHLFDYSFCPPNWLFFCVHVFGHPPGSNLLSWILSHSPFSHCLDFCYTLKTEDHQILISLSAPSSFSHSNSLYILFTY